MEQRFGVHVVFRNKQAKQRLHGIQLQTMKSCDFLALLRILTVYYDNLFHCTNQSGQCFSCSSVSVSKECNQAAPSFADRSTKATKGILGRPRHRVLAEVRLINECTI